MQTNPLSIVDILEHGSNWNASSRVWTLQDDGRIDELTFAEIGAKAAQLARGLTTLGVGAGDRVCSYMWNNAEHLVAYLAVPSMGAVLHTANIRLTAAQNCFTVAQAGDRVLLVDANLLDDILIQLRAMRSVETVVAQTVRRRRNALCHHPSHLPAQRDGRAQPKEPKRMKSDDLIMVSVDDHIAEPADMFDHHVPEKYRDLAPRVVEDDRGIQQWWYGTIRGRNLGLNAVAGKPREMYNLDASRYDEMRPGCYDVHHRVRDMDAGGYLAALNFPNWTGFSGQVLSEGRDWDVNNVMIRAYNDWHVHEWCGAYPDRFIPCGLVALFDAEDAAREVRRLAAVGCHAVAFSENPEALGRPSIHSGYWDPFFSACCDVGTVICLHLGSSSRPIDMSSDAPVSVAPTLSNARTINTLTELLWSSLWTRFPQIRFALSEGDIGWIPYFLARAQHVQDVQSGWTMHEFPDGMDAIDIFQRHFLCCFIEDRVGLRLLDYFNIDNLSWESDFPHSDSNWPNAPEQLFPQLDGLPRSTIDKITYKNALRHYQFDPFVKRTAEESTVAALRATATDVDTVTHVGRVNPDKDRQIAEFRARFKASPTSRNASVSTGADREN